MWKIRNEGELVLRRTVTRWAKGPVRVRFLSITNSSLLRLTVVTFWAKLIVSPDEALTMACRKEPGPWSFPFVTVMLAAGVLAAVRYTTKARNNGKERFFMLGRIEIE